MTFGILNYEYSKMYILITLYFNTSYTKYGYLRGRDTIVWFTCKRYEKMLFLEIY